MNDKISIIVPIYNVEQYLDKCVNSLVNQTHKNIEIILVDDGSKDNCAKICDFWKEKDDRIKVIHKKNGGLSDARNAGMHIASGDYIGFVDSDDWVNENMYEILLKNMIENNCDISACGVKKVYENDIVEPFDISNDKLYFFTREQSLSSLINENKIKQTVWNKLYKRDVIDDIYFEFGKTHEDEFWSYQVFGNSNKSVYTEYELYYYLQRSGSIMAEDFSEKRVDGLEGRYNRLIYIKQNYPKLELDAKLNLFFSCLYQYQCMIRSCKKEEKNKYSRIIKDYINKIDFTKNEKNRISLKNKMWVFMSKISLNLVSNFRNFFNIGV